MICMLLFGTKSLVIRINRFVIQTLYFRKNYVLSINFLCLSIDRTMLSEVVIHAHNRL